MTCNYRSFNFVAREDNKVVGIITGYSYYKEIYIEDLIIVEENRNKHIGTKLVENYYKDKGFEVKFIRENKEKPKLAKYFFVKYF